MIRAVDRPGWAAFPTPRCRAGPPHAPCRDTSSAFLRSTTTAPRACFATGSWSRPPRKSGSRGPRATSAFPRAPSGSAWTRRVSRTSELEAVAFYDKPLLKLDRVFETFLWMAPAGFASFRHGAPLWARDRLDIERTIRRGLAGYEGRVLFIEHHESHAGSAFYPSPFARRGHPDRRRGGRMGHGVHRRRPRARPRTRPGIALAGFAGPALFGVHVPCRVQGELGRVQADGARALRRAEVRGRHT